MKRIILHWSAGTHKAGKLDRKHYHFIIQGDGSVVEGNLPPEANENTSTPYAAHTRGINTGSIGVALAAMNGAKERPFNAGKYPITEKQVDALVKLTARLCARYAIPVQRDRVLTHAEVQPVLGVKQRGKWDINWLPGMKAPASPSVAGDDLRKRILAEMKPQPTPQTAPAKKGLFAVLLSLFARISK